MSKIKICGLTREEDIHYVNECLPDYIGFVFAESRRQVDRKQADRMREKLDGRICPVGVFVNESADIVAELLNEEIIDIAQLHGDEGEDYIGLLKEKMKRGRIIQAVRVRQREDILEKLQSSADYLLFDTYAGQAYGGTGKTFRWELTQGGGDGRKKGQGKNIRDCKQSKNIYIGCTEWRKYVKRKIRDSWRTVYTGNSDE